MPTIKEITFTESGLSLVKDERGTSYEMTFKLTPGRDNVEITYADWDNEASESESISCYTENHTTSNARLILELQLDVYGFQVKDNS